MNCRRTLVSGSAVIVLSIAVAGSLGAQEQTRRARWWRSAEVQQDLQLTCEAWNDAGDEVFFVLSLMATTSAR